MLIYNSKLRFLGHFWLVSSASPTFSNGAAKAPLFVEGWRSIRETRHWRTHSRWRPDRWPSAVDPTNGRQFQQTHFGLSAKAYLG
jgi:hypothetical protein